MRVLALVSGASHRPVARTPGRMAGFLERLDELGPVDLVVVHDDGVGADPRRAWRAVHLPGASPTPGVDGGVAEGAGRVLEVAARPLPRSGMLREVHLHGSDAPGRAARRTAWFRLVDSFLASAPGGHGLVWCADLAALTRAGWIRRALPAAVDVDAFEDLGSLRSRRSARRAACVAHLVTIGTEARRDQLALPGSVVAGPDAGSLVDSLAELASHAASYKPALRP